MILNYEYRSNHIDIETNDIKTVENEINSNIKIEETHIHVNEVEKQLDGFMSHKQSQDDIKSGGGEIDKDSVDGTSNKTLQQENQNNEEPEHSSIRVSQDGDFKKDPNDTDKPKKAAKKKKSKKKPKQPRDFQF